MGPHAWNIVNIGEKPYHLDVTWDISFPESTRIAYDYFNLSDDLMNLEHNPENVIPKCNKGSANQFIKSRRDFQTRYTLLKYIQAQIEQGKKKLVFRINGRLKNENIVPVIEKFLQKKYQNTEAEKVVSLYKANKKIGVYYMRVS